MKVIYSDLYYKRFFETQNKEDLDRSFSAAEKALDNAPYDAGINAKLAKLYQNTGDYENAKNYYEAATKYSAYTLNSFIEFGNMYAEIGEKEKSIGILLGALNRAPYAIKRAPADLREATVDSVAIIHLTLANIYNELGDKDKVQEQVNQLIELKETYPFLEKYFD